MPAIIRPIKAITRSISTTDGGVKKFPVSYMPDEVLSRISDAQDMAETAQNTANTAKNYSGYGSKYCRNSSKYCKRCENCR